MTRPGEYVGSVTGELRIATDKVGDDVEAGLEEAGRDGDKQMKKIGEEWGDTLGESVEKGAKDTGKNVARHISTEIDKEGVHVKNVTFETDSNGNITRTWVRTIARNLEDAVRSESGGGSSGGSGGGGGIFSPITNAIRDAIGAGFNISGKSPLVALLPLVIGGIVELVVGAIQAINGLVAVLLVIPSLIGAIIIQAGTLFLAFKGVGTAIQGAFAAKDANELNEAIKGLTPSAQKFVKSLLPIRDIFPQFRDMAQEKFFNALGDSLIPVVKALGGITLNGIGDIANALGDLGRTVITFFADPVFVRFFTQLIPATVRWINEFNPAIGSLLVGLANLGSAVMPFFEWLGQQLNGALGDFGEWLSSLSVDPGFIQWLEDMKTNLVLTADAIGSIIGLLATLTESLQKAGGNEALKDLQAQLDRISEFLASDEGVKTLEGLLHVTQILAWLLISSFQTLLLFLFLIEITAEFLKNGALPAVGQFFSWLGDKVIWLIGVIISIPRAWLATFEFIGKYIMQWLNGFFEWLGGLLTTIVDWVGGILGWLLTKLFEIAGSVAVWIHDRIEDVIEFFKSIPGRVTDAVGNMADTLFEAGKNLIGGLVRGVLSQVGYLRYAMGFIGSIISFFFPHSPAKEGPLSPQEGGDPFQAGQTIVERLGAGMEIASPSLRDSTSNVASNVLLGTGAVQMNFYGAPPTTAQAGAIGVAAGGGVADALAQRNTRLAIRAIGASA